MRLVERQDYYSIFFYLLLIGKLEHLPKRCQRNLTLGVQCVTRLTPVLWCGLGALAGRHIGFFMNRSMTFSPGLTKVVRSDKSYGATRTCTTLRPGRVDRSPSGTGSNSNMGVRHYLKAVFDRGTHCCRVR
jgi:hypothetical protein